jgi:hypothetical protein
MYAVGARKAWFNTKNGSGKLRGFKVRFHSMVPVALPPRQVIPRSVQPASARPRVIDCTNGKPAQIRMEEYP